MSVTIECPICGDIIFDDLTVCRNCGYKMDDDTNEAEVKKAKESSDAKKALK